MALDLSVQGRSPIEDDPQIDISLNTAGYQRARVPVLLSSEIKAFFFKSGHLI